MLVYCTLFPGYSQWLDLLDLDKVYSGSGERSTICHRKNHNFLWENHGKTMGKPWENGDLYGKIMKDPPFYSWVNPLFRMGHGFNSYTVITRG